MLQRLAIFAIQFYRYTVSNLCWGSCRFYPTCSKYALTAIERFGLWKGGCLCVKRLGRCHPFCDGGYDPVPEANQSLNNEVTS